MGRADERFADGRRDEDLRLSVVRGIDVQLVSNGSIGKGGDEFGEVGVGVLGLDPVFEVCRLQGRR
jgi:hypothetical protein